MSLFKALFKNITFSTYVNSLILFVFHCCGFWVLTKNWAAKFVPGAVLVKRTEVVSNIGKKQPGEKQRSVVVFLQMASNVRCKFCINCTKLMLNAIVNNFPQISDRPVYVTATKQTTSSKFDLMLNYVCENIAINLWICPHIMCSLMVCCGSVNLNLQHMVQKAICCSCYCAIGHLWVIGNW